MLFFCMHFNITCLLIGQLLAFKKAVARKLDKRVRITAVDNFQGEENDIILLSLVRSNAEVRIFYTVI